MFVSLQISLLKLFNVVEWKLALKLGKFNFDL
jgi:hypothetical protein